MLAALKRLLARMAAEHVIVVTGMALEGTRVSTVREHASTGLGAPSVLDLIEFGLETNHRDHLGMSRTLKFDAITDLEALALVQQTHDNCVPELRLLLQQLGIAKNIQALANTKIRVTTRVNI